MASARAKHLLKLGELGRIVTAESINHHIVPVNETSTFNS